MIEHNISVIVSDKEILTETPFHPDWAPAAKTIDGAYQGGGRWKFDTRDEERVRELCIKVFGTDGSPGELVTAYVDLEKGGFDRYRVSNLWLLGRNLASRRDRDESVRLGDGVIVHQGGFPGRGGSKANPDLEAQPGTILEVRDIPAQHPQLTHQGVTIVERLVDKDALRAEREKLVARLEKIHELLEED